MPNLPGRRPGPSVRRTVVVHAGGSESRREDRVATEEPLEIRVAAPGLPARRVWTTMRTPGNDFELAAGWAINEARTSPEGISRVAYCTERDLDPLQQFNVVTLTLDQLPDLPEQLTATTAGSSACGVCGRDSLVDVLEARSPLPWSGPLPSVETIRDLPGRLRERQPLFDRTGGVHAAALVDGDGNLLVVREDVGRHNAVDKVVGARALAGEPVASAALVVSGRAGFELVQKAVVSGTGCLVSVGAPTSLAVDLAREAGIALWGFTAEDRTVRYA